MRTIHGKNARTHAVKRAKQRYALKLSQTDIIALKKVINKELHNCPQNIWFKGRFCKVVYNAEIKEIVTFLPCFQQEVIESLGAEYKWREV